jgi:hypothetical protein
MRLERICGYYAADTDVNWDDVSLAVANFTATECKANAQKAWFRRPPPVSESSVSPSSSTRLQTLDAFQTRRISHQSLSFGDGARVVRAIAFPYGERDARDHVLVHADDLSALTRAPIDAVVWVSCDTGVSATTEPYVPRESLRDSSDPSVAFLHTWTDTCARATVALE